MKTILGLDLGTNSIGWALVQQDEKEKSGNIIAAGSRILPMSQDVLGKFDSGQSISQTAERTGYRGIRRLRERHLLRRERLHRVLYILGFLPQHYAKQIDFDKKLGQFIPDAEPKLQYAFNSVTDKVDFLFKNSFDEMLQDFEKYQPQLLKGNKKIPYDWTIYYLRKKALSAKIEKEELAWLLLNFNQKRGYYQLRGEEEEENPNKRVVFYSLAVTAVTADEPQRGKDDIWYNIVLENGWIYRRSSKVPLFDWVGKVKEFIVTEDLNDDKTVKTDKEGKEKRSFKAVDSEQDWIAVKKSTEEKIDRSDKMVGAFIYDSLLNNPTQKIKGKLVRVIERKFYKRELEIILKKQQTFHNELKDIELYNACLDELYENNDAHRNNIRQKDFVYLFLNDIIFYQRPLKSKKSLISNCKFESRTFLKDGKKEVEPLKCIAKSHPLFQEFRIWQWMQNLRIYKKAEPSLIDVTSEIITSENDWIDLFEWLNTLKEVDNKALLNFLLKPLRLKPGNYRWNYVYDEINDTSKSYPCNETRWQIISRLKKIKNVPSDFLNRENEEALWHILYSVEDKEDIKKALKTFSEKQGLEDDFVDAFEKSPPFKKEYGSYSAKAIKKFLPLMRLGKYWSEQDIHPQTKERISKIIDGEYDNKIKDRVREKALAFTAINHFQFLPLWLVSYIVYDRHSEDEKNGQWKTANDIELLEQHSLRNPIVEQIINETLQVVREIWKKHGNSEVGFFNEIHVELSREMKNPADRRREMTNKVVENENTNLRIKALLAELLNDREVENVRPYSPMQQEILKIYEDGVLNAQEGNIPDEILKISKQAQPTSTELIRYKLWLQQKYKSPYTGAIIPLNKLFTREYDIEHIIPQSRYFDDSFNNKVICETAVNSDKGNYTAYEYILKRGGAVLDSGYGPARSILRVEEFEDFVKQHYGKSRGKMQRLMMEDIPETFIQRQLNDTRYISKVVKGLLSNIVREDDEQGAISKNVIVSNGAITSKLKQDWGLSDIWNDIIIPRFERLNTLTSSNNFGEWTNKDGKRVFQTQMPIELQKGFSKKRIDHRHHALDAIVIACATLSHINFLNNESALGKATKEEKEKKRFDLRHKLCIKKYNDDAKQNYKWVFNKPWDTFTQDTRKSLFNIVVSFKQNLRVINKSVNYYQALKKNEEGKSVKELVKQIEGDNWAIRKPMHKDTVSGLVRLKFTKNVTLAVAIDNCGDITDKILRKHIKGLISKGLDRKNIVKILKETGNKWNGIDVSKTEIFYWDNELVASRVKIDESFNSVKIQSITDTGIQKIILNHLEKYSEEKNGKSIEHPELAFSPDGIEELNKNIVQLNNGKQHQPIYKVRTYETRGNKFNVGTTGNKKQKFVEAAKGTNLFFAIYKNESGKSIFETIPLNIVIERQKHGLTPVPEVNELGYLLSSYLSPNDLVYLPTEEEKVNSNIQFKDVSKEQIQRIYKMVSSSGYQCFFVRHDIANPVVNKVEFGPLNKTEKSIDGIMIKESCIKLKVDRLGNVQPA
ncbi:type II CRISPR RNA-guided endonuclease Cas9 [Mucilaginibacter sp.]|uniref:type II CRISPR RNA-guided endonuclease Cas9 n=1 Tax=Mucilaginibacter sp. TaxID=1882438 RepID=UPI002ED09699